MLLTKAGAYTARQTGNRNNRRKHIALKKGINSFGRQPHKELCSVLGGDSREAVGERRGAGFGRFCVENKVSTEAVNKQERAVLIHLKQVEETYRLS